MRACCALISGRSCDEAWMGRSGPAGCMHQLACICCTWGSDKWPSALPCLGRSLLGKQQADALDAQRSRAAGLQLSAGLPLAFLKSQAPSDCFL